MNIINQRIEKLRELMHENGISFYIIYTADPHFSEYIDEHFKVREYMSGFTGSAGTLVVSDKEAALFVDGRYHIQADIETNDSCITVYKLGLKGVPSVSDYLLTNINAESTIGFNGKCFSQTELEKLINKLGDLNYLYEDNLVEYVYDELPKMNCFQIMYLPLAITGKSITDKLSEVRLKMKEHGADAYFISSLDDIMWLFNIRGRDIKYNTTAYSYAYITEHSATLYANEDAYNISLINGLESEGVIIAGYDEIEIELCKLKCKNILLDKAFTSCYFYKILDTGNNIISINNYEIIAKHIKNKTECDNARKYAITDAVQMIKFIKNIKEDIRLGIEFTEYEMARFLDGYRSNAKDFYSLSFDTIVAYNENAAIVHYSPDKKTSKTIEDKGFLLVDSGSHYLGATTDITRTIAFTRLTQEEKDAYTYVLKSNLALMNAKFLDGTSCEALDILAREPLWRLGLDYMHGTGHGIGSFLNVHEGPVRISYKGDSSLKMKPGMIVSDEPGLYILNKYGIRHETQLLCVEIMENEYGKFYGFEPLSLVPFDIDAINLSLLTFEEKNILNQYHKMIREKISNYLDEYTKKWLEIATREVD